MYGFAIRRGPRAALVAIIAIVLFLTTMTASASANYGTLTSGSCTLSYSNGQSPLRTTTTTNGSCGNIGMSARIYYGGGSYAWTSITWYGSYMASYWRDYSGNSMTNSRHYYLSNYVSITA